MLSSLQEIADFLLTPILGPLLDLPPVLTILVVAIFVSGVSTLFQKHFTNQKRLKKLKKDLKKHQEELKKARKDPEKQLKIQKKMTPLQLEMMRESFKPALWTMLPFMLLFLWLSGHFAYAALAPGDSFIVTADVNELGSVQLETPEGITLLTPADAVVEEGVARWEMQGKAGSYVLTFSGDDTTITKRVLITQEKEYETPIETYSGPISKITIGNKPLKPLDPLSLFGWRPGWLIVYIFFSIVISISLRKALDIA